MRRSLLLSLLLASAACPGRYRPSPAAPVTAAGRGVEDAALPYAWVDARTGRAVTDSELWTAVGAARAVCIGEEHPNPHHHWAQLTIVGAAATKITGKRLALGMEMVQAPFQGVLDDWSAHKIDDPALLSRTGWADRWGYDFALYRPILDQARANGMALVALNAPRELVKAVAKLGVDGISAAERAKLPALVLDDAQHRAWFDALMAGMEHGGGHGQTEAPATKPDDETGAGTAAVPPAAPSADNIYAAQVVWDESMAEHARRWLGEGGDTIVIIAGTGHCHDSAIVRRLVRRGGGPALSIRPIIDDGEGNVARALAEATNDYLFVMTMPKPSPR